MDVDPSRLFLLSMITVPAACGPGVAPGGTGAVSPIPSHDPDGLVPDDVTRGGGCEVFYATLYACYGGYDPMLPYDGTTGSLYGVGGGGTYGSGYSGTTGGGYPGRGTVDLSGLCSERYAELEAYLGRDCARAYDDALSCLGALSCQALLQENAELPSACLDAYIAVESTCTSPSVDLGGCDPPSINNDSVNCSALYGGCADGSFYVVSCMPPPGDGLHLCVCQRDNATTGSFQVENPCDGTTLASLAASSCGYPV